MATTSKGTPYVEAADLVSGYPTVSLNLAEHIDDNIAYNAATINAQTGTTYTFALADATEGKLVTATNAASQTYTVPPESSVAWPIGSVLRILNQGAGTVTVAAGSGVTINGTPLTLAQYKGAAIQKTGTNTWTFIPFSGGVGSAVISSPAATGSYSSGGTTYNYYTFTASGTLTVDAAGFADVLVVGGGGAGSGSNSGGNQGGAGGGGAGGCLNLTNGYLPAGTATIRIGAGGSADGGIGGVSLVTPYYGVGGGGGGYQNSAATSGGSGGGAGCNNANFGAAVFGQGNNGSASMDADTAGGGGGSNAAATNANGGAGLSSSITGSAANYGGGGGGGSWGGGGTGGGGNAGGDNSNGSPGTANTGGGGGGAGKRTSSGSNSGGNGGSGIVIVRVAV